MAAYKETKSPILIKDSDIREMANAVARQENKMVTTLCSEVLRDSLKSMLRTASCECQAKSA